MEFCVYVLYSKSFDKIYIGQTSNLIARFKSHNSMSKKGYTLKYRPWVVAHVEFYMNRPDALKREKALKQGQGRNWIRKSIIVKYC